MLLNMGISVSPIPVAVVSKQTQEKTKTDFPNMDQPLLFLSFCGGPFSLSLSKRSLDSSGRRHLLYLCPRSTSFIPDNPTKQVKDERKGEQSLFPDRTNSVEADLMQKEGFSGAGGSGSGSQQTTTTAPPQQVDSLLIVHIIFWTFLRNNTE